MASESRAPDEEQGDLKDRASKGDEQTRLLVQSAPEDDVKTHMANERTFFKWVWSALHLGSVGTFVLAFFSKGHSPTRKLPFVIFCWVVALGFLYYGLYQYCTRRHAIRTGSLDRSEWQNPAGPVAITVAFTLVVLLAALPSALPA
mmetsp:Transcript_18/g.47  ORF Transcript_18/g.47 Transcript_18/m.47 type:complete len:146 (+) Transcript_18:390-827(+)